MKVAQSVKQFSSLPIYRGFTYQQRCLRSLIHSLYIMEGALKVALTLTNTLEMYRRACNSHRMDYSICQYLYKAVMSPSIIFHRLSSLSIFLYIIWSETPSSSKFSLIGASKNGPNSYGSFYLVLNISLFWIVLIVINDTTTVSDYGKVTETPNFQSDAHG